MMKMKIIVYILIFILIILIIYRLLSTPPNFMASGKLSIMTPFFREDDELERLKRIGDDVLNPEKYKKEEIDDRNADDELKELESGNQKTTILMTNCIVNLKKVNDGIEGLKLVRSNKINDLRSRKAIVQLKHADCSDRYHSRFQKYKEIFKEINKRDLTDEEISKQLEIIE